MTDRQAKTQTMRGRYSTLEAELEDTLLQQGEVSERLRPLVLLQAEQLATPDQLQTVDKLLEVQAGLMRRNRELSDSIGRLLRKEI